MKDSDFKSTTASKRGLFIRTFGCQMNEYDSAKLYRLLADEYSAVESPEEADLILVNTCSVREKPEHKVYSYLGELKPLKRSNPNLLIGVGGCVAQQEGRTIIERSGNVDFVFGTHNLSLVPSLIALRRNGAPPQVAVDYRDEWEELPLGFTTPNKVSVFISISRGCNKKCAYCIVPYTRGPEVSRPADEIAREAALAVRRGAREITLLGQNVNSYGRDLTPRQSFASLLETLSIIDSLERIRFTSPHPQEVQDDFLDACFRNPKICRHMHLPLQSGSNAILRAMRRSYRREKYLEIVAALRSRMPDMSFTTDIIVGFPGETESDFMDTVDLVRAVEFDSSFSFMYSPRPGTPAASLPGQLPEDEKLRRLQYLQSVQEELTARRLSAWIGKRGEVLLDSESAQNNTILRGRLSQNILVNLDKAYSGLQLGTMISVVISGAGKHTLKGEPIEIS